MFRYCLLPFNCGFNAKLMRIYNLQPTGTGELVIFSVFVLRKSEIYNRIVLASRDKL